jgi:hypothetical protein
LWTSAAGAAALDAHARAIEAANMDLGIAVNQMPD